MGLEFTICKVRSERYPKVSENTHAREWLEFQATRGLASNTLDAYGRNLDRFLGFVESRNIRFDSVARNTIGAYIRCVAELPVARFSRKTQETKATLANATLQQHLTVIRLFYDYLVEENRANPKNALMP
jgi:integrase/recombinase XerD